ncbi:MAG: thioredoxin domain-containing protein [Planctomycetes bacterium]|nr:thioredoxin domain-containing protein [Planctomycetota bacterium]
MSDAPHTNRLAASTSPYLLQHAHNPVDWYPWGEEALTKARLEDKPILLSVGYSACHWCHVMERESFEDESTAELMNEHFVSIKVDREERPDLDEIYMQATLALNQGHGGWPMNVFLTPKLEPFFAGTYFPPTDGQMPAWKSVCRALAEAWKTKRTDVGKTAEALTRLLREGTERSQQGPLAPALLEAARTALAARYDAKRGGFGPAPKFPRAEAIQLLLRHHAQSGDEASLDMATQTLLAMGAGGIYDHLGGGFARYSTDAAWLVPHFEKMLYDNALLIPAYLAGYQASGEGRLREVARETLDYLLREMLSPEGAFYSATDAASEGVEGKFFCWTIAELEAVLGPERTPQVAAYYGATEAGNWEGTNVLHTPRSLEEVASELGLEPRDLRRTVLAARKELYGARLHRVHPSLDDKILTSWNGLALSAFAAGARVLGEERYLEAAEKTAGFLLERMVRPDAGLFRVYRAGQSHVAAVLEDYAYLCAGLLDLYEAGGARRNLAAAAVLSERMLQDFADPDGGGFFHTPLGHGELIIRYREGHDGATPSPNSVAAHALARLAVHLESPDLHEVAKSALEGYGLQVQEQPRGFCTALAAADFLAQSPLEVVLSGDKEDPTRRDLWRAFNSRYLPNTVVAHATAPDAGDEELPLLRGRAPSPEGATLYICRQGTCLSPVRDPAQVADAMERALA